MRLSRRKFTFFRGPLVFIFTPLEICKRFRLYFLKPSKIRKGTVCFLKYVFLMGLIISWIFFGWPQIWQNPRIPPDVERALALNQLANWAFTGNSTGWSSTNGSGTNTCGDNNTSATTNLATFAYNANKWRSITGTTASTNYRGMIYQTFTAPGSGTVKIKGNLNLDADVAGGGSWGSGWIRLDIYDSANSTYVANLACESFTSNQTAHNTSFGTASLTGGTIYAVRITMSGTVGNKALTFLIDNITVNTAPVGLSASAPADTTNAQLDWTASTAGSGAPAIHATTPYKVYRDTDSPVSTYLADATSNSYTDTSATGNTTYYYAVSNVDTNSVESPLSAEASILTRPGAPGTPTFSNVAETTLTINWTEPTGGASSYKVERCTGSSCSDFSQIASGVTDLFYNDSELTGNTLYRYRVLGTNATPADGAYSGIGEQTTASGGALTVDIVNGSYVSVGSPTMAMNNATFSLICQTVTGSFGTASQQIYVNNNDAADGGWTLSLAATNPTDVWDSAGTDYDFNEAGSSGCVDDGATTDSDSLGGQMTVNPSGATLAVGQCGGCSTTGVSLGDSEAFVETTNNDIDIVTGAVTSDDIGDWTAIGVSVSQKIPAEQAAASDYDINMALTVTAIQHAMQIQMAIKIKRVHRGKFIFTALIASLIFFNILITKISASGITNLTIQIFYAQITQEIDTIQSSSATLTNPNNSSLGISLPADVLISGDAVELTAHSTPEGAVTTDKPLPSGKVGADIFYNISFQKVSDSSAVSSFDKAVTLTFYYDDSDISGINESTLKAYRWNGSAWSALSDSSVDTSLNKVTATIQQFSNLALLGDPSSVCGNGAVESGEQCDAGGSNGSCPATCSVSCTTNSCTSGGGGGGGGGGYVVPVTSVIFNGRAYPKRTVTLLKDAQIVATTITDANANFSVNISGLTGGNYIFSVYSEDNKGNRSSLLTFPISVTSGATTQISNIFIAPTIAIDKSEVKRGDNIAIFGQSASQADIVVSVNSEEEFFGKTISDKDGIYLYNFDSSFVEYGTHYTKSKASIGNQAVSNFSNVISFLVGTKNIAAELPKVVTKGDMNNDRRVNLVDFSVAAYWYKRPSPPATADLNNDGKVDLVDFSIMAFYWTG